MFFSFSFLAQLLLKGGGDNIILCHTIPGFNDCEKEAFEKHCGKKENAGNQYFLLLQQCFLLYQGQVP